MIVQQDGLSDFKKRRQLRVNLNMATIQYCIDTLKIEGRITILNDGNVVGFKEEKDHASD